MKHMDTQFTGDETPDIDDIIERAKQLYNERFKKQIEEENHRKKDRALNGG